jgi:hypothetical protein
MGCLASGLKGVQTERQAFATPSSSFARNTEATYRLCGQRQTNHYGKWRNTPAGYPVLGVSTAAGFYFFTNSFVLCRCASVFI